MGNAPKHDNPALCHMSFILFWVLTISPCPFQIITAPAKLPNAYQGEPCLSVIIRSNSHCSLSFPPLPPHQCSLSLSCCLCVWVTVYGCAALACSALTPKLRLMLIGSSFGMLTKKLFLPYFNIIRQMFYRFDTQNGNSCTMSELIWVDDKDEILCSLKFINKAQVIHWYMITDGFTRQSFRLKGIILEIARFHEDTQWQSFVQLHAHSFNLCCVIFFFKKEAHSDDEVCRCCYFSSWHFVYL